MTMTAMQELEDPQIRRINWRLWGRIFARMRPYPGPTWVMIVSGLLIAAVETALPLLTAGIIDSVTGERVMATTGTFAENFVTADHRTFCWIAMI